MISFRLLRLACLIFITTASSAQVERPAAKRQFVSVEPSVKLKVLDWGGTGRAVVFLAGMGLDAHEFDEFAPKFAPMYHVYAITRRGFGASSAPIPTKDNYSADRLGDDLMAVIAILKLDRPVLVGHSLAGEELSSVATRYPNKVSGLVYLDAGYPDALYSPTVGDPILDATDLQHQLDLLFAATLQTQSDFANMEASVARFDLDLKGLMKRLALSPAAPPRPANAPAPSPILLALVNGAQKYTAIHVPVLAIFAVPQAHGETVLAQVEAFQTGVPQARVVRIDNANHFVFRSNEKQVFEEMSTFLASLPR